MFEVADTVIAERKQAGLEGKHNDLLQKMLDDIDPVMREGLSDENTVIKSSEKQSVFNQLLQYVPLLLCIDIRHSRLDLINTVLAGKYEFKQGDRSIALLPALHRKPKILELLMQKNSDQDEIPSQQLETLLKWLEVLTKETSS